MGERGRGSCGGAFVGSRHAGKAVAYAGDQLDGIMDIIVALFGPAAGGGGSGVTASQIAAQMSTSQIDQHGDPGKWKYDGKKDGSGAQGKNMGDVKCYELWIDAYHKVVEVHYFRDPSGAVREGTITIK